MDRGTKKMSSLHNEHQAEQHERQLEEQEEQQQYEAAQLSTNGVYLITVRSEAYVDREYIVRGKNTDDAINNQINGKWVSVYTPNNINWVGGWCVKTQFLGNENET